MTLYQRVLSRFLGVLIWPFVGEITGREHFPADGPALLAGNHLSVLDGLVLALTMDNTVRHTHFVSYKYLFAQPLTGYFLRLNEGVVLDNTTPEGREQTMAECRELLSRGKVVGMFPEAHTAPFEAMHKAQPGMAVLSLETGAPVVPVGLVGTQKVIPRKGDLPGVRWKAVRVHFGRPLDFNRYREPYRQAQGRRQRLDIALGVTTIIMRAVAALSGQEYPHGAKSLARLERIAAEGAG